MFKGKEYKTYSALVHLIAQKIIYDTKATLSIKLFRQQKGTYSDNQTDMTNTTPKKLSIALRPRPPSKLGQ
jgi:hypothetical protein